jgi:hypothetical protein
MVLSRAQDFTDQGEKTSILFLLGQKYSENIEMLFGNFGSGKFDKYAAA